jgi:FAD-dependent urate hydroxylase
MPWADPPTALVIGAGFAGLASAISLLQAGWSVQMLERRPGSPARAAGIVLHPNALAALDQLGVLEEVQDAGTPIDTLTIHGARQVDVQLRDVWPAASRATLAVGRTALTASLLARSEHLGARLRTGTAVSTVVEGLDGGAEAHMADGSVVTADLIVGCDGVHSVVRRALQPDAEAQPLGAWWARWIAPPGLVAARTWQTWTDRTATCGAYGIGTAGTHVFLQLAAADAEGGLDAAVAPQLDVFEPLRGAIDADAQLVHAGPGHAVRPHHWGAGSMALVGDAAHALSPTMSEGGGLALEDGVALGHEARTAGSAEDLLARYRRRREQRVAWVARMGDLQLRRTPRTSGGTPLDSTAVTSYLRAIYQPLMEAT